jgi:transposase
MKHEDQERRRKKILDTYAKTGTIRRTAKTLEISRNVVRRVLRGQDGTRALVQRTAKASKLEAFKPVLQRLILEDQLTAVLALEEIRTLGYAGGYSILKEYVRTIRPMPKVKVTTVLDHAPGAEGQVDWSPYTVKLAGETRVVHAFSMVLPFSRYMVVRFTFEEILDTLLRLHEEAFADIGGIPKLMTYDNMTTVGRHVGEDQIQLNPRFEAYARECGFDVWLIDPGRPNQHASVERPMHYIENNCLRRRRFTFADLDDLNQHAKAWCANVANVRVHGTTRERPVDRLLRERAFLLPLPSSRPEPFHTVARGVGSDFCVRLDTNRYSVPPKHVGEPATVHVYPERLEILIKGAVVAVHVLCHDRHQRKVLPEHEAAFKLVTPSRRLLEAAFLRLGPAARDYHDGLLTHRGRGAGYHLQRILKLADRHGSSVVTGAMAYAARYGNYSADAVARVILGRELRRPSRGSNTAVPIPPDRAQRWLEGLDVESADLADYDRLIDRGSEDEEDTNDAEG